MEPASALHTLFSNALVHDYPTLDLDGNLHESLIGWANSYVFVLNQISKRHRLNMAVSVNSADSSKQTICLVVQSGIDQTTGLIEKKTIFFIQQRQGALTFREKTIEAFSDKPRLALARMILHAVVEAA